MWRLVCYGEFDTCVLSEIWPDDPLGRFMVLSAPAVARVLATTHRPAGVVSHLSRPVTGWYDTTLRT